MVQETLLKPQIFAMAKINITCKYSRKILLIFLYSTWQFSSQLRPCSDSNSEQVTRQFLSTMLILSRGKSLPIKCTRSKYFGDFFRFFGIYLGFLIFWDFFILLGFWDISGFLGFFEIFWDVIEIWKLWIGRYLTSLDTWWKPVKFSNYTFTFSFVHRRQAEEYRTKHFGHQFLWTIHQTIAFF